MRLRILASLLTLAAASTAIAQTTPTAPAAANPAAKPRNPAAAPSPTQPNPASVPVQPASDAGATERGMAPVVPGSPGVTNRVQDANANDRDAQGHLLDPHGKPVGQKATVPAPATTR
ncbi:MULTISPECIES: hypothetical protein [unclassified Luteibacter]|uniref:hypothetical protein n=1 Tax=unclassified Luteibacter TaxID=2620188 RepID=UPI0008BDFAB3|nr:MULTISPECIES: hypothetical protein [unclassified Luteibacter]SEP14425.1 hypothetical protein SAMN02800692_0046 [Luteibacter sp. UNC138MFCol5.1]SEV94363.1 hypothetical protein SAMN04515660_1181 [Luteibacter sp. 329MFSha]